MSFFEKAKQAATEMAAKADAAITQATASGQGFAGSTPGVREAETALRDFGLVTWREQAGYPVDPAERARVVAAMQSLSSSGVLASMRVTPPPAAPPPPPGAAAAAAAAAPPPPRATQQGAPPPPPPPPPSPAPDAPDARPTDSGGGQVPPPPPPSWA